MNLGENIRRRREHLKLSQEYIAERLGVSRQAVSKWESKKAGSLFLVSRSMLPLMAAVIQLLFGLQSKLLFHYKENVGWNHGTHFPILITRCYLAVRNCANLHVRHRPRFFEIIQTTDFLP